MKVIDYVFAVVIIGLGIQLTGCSARQEIGIFWGREDTATITRTTTDKSWWDVIKGSYGAHPEAGEFGSPSRK